MTKTSRKNWGRLLLPLMLALNCSATFAQQRALLYSRTPSAKLQEIVSLMRDPRSPRIDDGDQVRPSNFFVRIAPRANILAEGGADAILGTRPFVFLTSPEFITGRSLLDIYEGIGYEAEDIIRAQRNQDMVAIVFRYPDGVSLDAETLNGQLPTEWEKKVYVPTWDNMFTLFRALAEKATIEPKRVGEFAPNGLFFRSEAEKAFALNYAEGARDRIKRLSYTDLRAFGGADWVYRRLLENKLSAFEHFRGTGRTQNEVRDPDGKHSGLLEFVGPNAKLKDLPELAIIDLGRLQIHDDYFKE